ncbi:MAG TPA: hypothetical protein VMJ10_22605 [Kofleriaceae bacterium]|nr:hypothetical protein [Kofleriaceae bacterium]
MRLLVLIILLAPAVSFAQMAPPPPPPPPPPGAGPGYAPGPGYGYGVADPWAFHHGFTIETNLGVGWVHATASDGGTSLTNDSDAALAGADVSLGGWLNPQLAVTVRIAGVQVKNTVGGVTTPSSGEDIHGFVGPNVQYWLAPNIWVGGGIGLSVAAESGTDCTSNCSSTGFGFNLRAGYAIPLGGPHTLSLSVETNTGFYSQDDGMGNTISITATGISFLAGYQYL